MIRKRSLRAFLILAMGAAVGASIPAFPGRADGAQKDSAALTMEELEVRGYRVKPGQLYLAVPDPLFSPSPIRFDLFRDDITRPIQLWEIPAGTPEEGRKR